LADSVVDTLVVTPPVVVVTSAAEELLGTPSLTTAEKQSLDALGNRDGIYNLGDFLALLDRTGLQVSAELLHDVLAGRMPSRPDPAQLPTRRKERR
jgi:hypothetical protein